jgi:hypothetical protein
MKIDYFVGSEKRPSFGVEFSRSELKIIGTEIGSSIGSKPTEVGED